MRVITFVSYFFAIALHLVGIHATASCNAKNINLIKAGVLDEVSFCKFFNDGARSRSPFSTLGPADVSDACVCILASAPKVKQSTTKSSPQVTPTRAVSSTACDKAIVASVGKGFKDVTAFCNFWGAIPRLGSPLLGVSSAQVLTACQCILHPSATTTTRTSSQKPTSSLKTTTIRTSSPKSTSSLKTTTIRTSSPKSTSSLKTTTTRTSSQKPPSSQKTTLRSTSTMKAGSTLKLSSSKYVTSSSKYPSPSPSPTSLCHTGTSQDDSEFTYIDHSGAKYSVNCHTYLPGQTIDTRTLASFDACLLACDASQDCQFINYDTFTRTCILQDDQQGEANGKNFGILAFLQMRVPGASTSTVATSTSASPSSSPSPLCTVGSQPIYSDGAFHTDGSNQQYQIFCHYFVSSGLPVVGYSTFSTAEDCLGFCDNYDTCGAIQYQHSNGACFAITAGRSDIQKYSSDFYFAALKDSNHSSSTTSSAPTSFSSPSSSAFVTSTIPTSTMDSSSSSLPSPSILCTVGSQPIYSDGALYTDNNNQEYKMYCSYAIGPAATYVSSNTSPSYEGCLEYCDTFSQCTAIQYDFGTESCYAMTTDLKGLGRSGPAYGAALKVQQSSSSSTNSVGTSTMASSLMLTSTVPSSTSSLSSAFVTSTISTSTVDSSSATTTTMSPVSSASPSASAAAASCLDINSPYTDNEGQHWTVYCGWAVGTDGVIASKANASLEQCIELCDQYQGQTCGVDPDNTCVVTTSNTLFYNKSWFGSVSKAR